MNRGETKQLVHRETSKTPFTVSAATLTVTDPNGGVSSPSVGIDSDSAAKTHQLAASYLPAIAGPFKMVWLITINSQILRRVEWYFATFSNPYQQVRDLLQSNDLIVTDELLDTHFTLVVLRLLSKYATYIPDYESLSSIGLSDQQRFEAAVAYLTAARIRPFMPTSVATGALIGFEGSQDKFKYSDPIRKLDPIEDSWVKEATLLLSEMDLLKASYKSWQQGFAMTAFVGKRRTIDGAGYWVTALTPLKALLLDQLFYQGLSPLGDLEVFG